MLHISLVSWVSKRILSTRMWARMLPLFWSMAL
ncbi:Uncharacterised protein [Mycobacteroides abscessus subsp. abscessus]|nr:Uncharacterised protein [Mycobacteroides abscessus subsp. abscessus]